MLHSPLGSLARHTKAVCVHKWELCVCVCVCVRDILFPSHVTETKYCLLLQAMYKSICIYTHIYCWHVAIVDGASSDAAVKLHWVVNQWLYFIVFDIAFYRLKKFTFIRSRKLTDIVDNSVMPAWKWLMLNFWTGLPWKGNVTCSNAALYVLLW